MTLPGAGGTFGQCPAGHAPIHRKDSAMAEDGLGRDLLEDARELIAGEAWARLVALVSSLHPADLVDLVLSLEEADRRSLLDRLPTDIVGQLFEFVEDDELREFIRSVGVEDLPAVLDEVEDDVAADVIQQLEPEEQAETLAQLDRGDEVAELLQYGEDSAGGIMSRGFVALNEEISVGQAIEYLRVLRPASEKAYYLYVIDRDRRLQGTVSMRDLIVSTPRTKLAEITQHDVHAVRTSTDQEEAARTLQRYNLLAVPVVDEEGRLEGVTTADDLIDVLQEEATEDMYRMVGLDEEESASTPIRQTIRLRLPWLMVNLFTAFAGAFVVSLFDSTLEKAVVLAAFMPVVANQSGVTGTQTATIMVRSLALGERRMSITRILLREVFIGFTNGMVVGVLLGMIAFAFTGNATLAVILVAAMAAASAVATIVGQMVPLGLRALGADPALASSIFVTMCTDAMSFLFLLGGASMVISRLE
ncbi:MAG: magnesium transporter [Dehalococcoidia bacterium]|nr:magnesium transporter [Dehalococcoidia bacterium]